MVQIYNEDGVCKRCKGTNICPRCKGGGIFIVEKPDIFPIGTKVPCPLCYGGGDCKLCHGKKKKFCFVH